MLISCADLRLCFRICIKRFSHDAAQLSSISAYKLYRFILLVPLFKFPKDLDQNPINSAQSFKACIIDSV